MDEMGLSIEGICALKQAQIQEQFSVQVLKKENDQKKAEGAMVVEAIAGTGKGQHVNTIA